MKKKPKSVEDSIGEELAQIDIKDQASTKKKNSGGKKKAVSPDMGSSGSDDWEKLSSGEKSPKKTSREVQFYRILPVGSVIQDENHSFLSGR